MDRELPELWCCERCEAIGSAQQAQTHEAETGHTVRRLNAAEASGVREIWAEEGRDPMGDVPSRRILGTLLTEHGRALARSIAGGMGGGGLDGPDF